jgi:hypothetical protein
VWDNAMLTSVTGASQPL